MASDSADIEQTFTITVLDDFAEKTNSDCTLVLEPLGDGVGWRVLAVTSNEQILGKASSVNLFEAIDACVARSLERLKAVLECDDAEDDEADDRQ